MWLEKGVARYLIKGDNILLRGDIETRWEMQMEKNRKDNDTLKILNKTSYNKYITQQEYTVYFHISE